MADEKASDESLKEADKILARASAEYGDETFIAPGYAFHEDLRREVALALDKVRRAHGQDAAAMESERLVAHYRDAQKTIQQAVEYARAKGLLVDGDFVLGVLVHPSKPAQTDAERAEDSSSCSGCGAEPGVSCHGLCPKPADGKGEGNGA